jgi:hypothetical protein
MNIFLLSSAINAFECIGRSGFAPVENLALDRGDNSYCRYLHSVLIGGTFWRDPFKNDQTFAS